MKKRCNNCLHWDSEGDKIWGDCTKASSTDAEPDDRTSLAVSYDFEGYMSGLNTHATFGCIQWEKRNAD